jgi:hypothetical protein
LAGVHSAYSIAATRLSLVSDLIETVEQCNWKLVMLEEELPRLKKTGEVK